jgi:segregation and condensation protein B
MSKDAPQEIPRAATAPGPAADASGQLLAALEAVLFMAAEPITSAELAEILEVAPADVAQLATRLDDQYSGRGIQIQRVAGGYQVCTRPEYGPYVAKLHKPERFRLSRAALETLAIVAYKQPITRPEIEAIRGVNSDSPVDTLTQYELICEAGRKDSPGRPVLYRTTDNFLGQFGLNSVEDLPRVDLPRVEPSPAAEESTPPGPDSPDGPARHEGAAPQVETGEPASTPTPAAQDEMSSEGGDEPGERSS